jgi:hypothetical protein
MSRLLPACFLCALAALPCPAPACSLCGDRTRQQDTLRQEIERARIVVFGTVANPRFAQGGLPGAGVTDLKIERVVKYDRYLDGKNTIQLDRYIPILDPKDPPRFLVFCDLSRDRLDTYEGRQVRSKAVLDYLEGAKAHQAKGRTEALKYYYRFLDHADETVANDAFLEFARSTDAEVGQVARHLDPDKLRRLVQNPKVTQDRLSLFAFLLGACGKDKDAQLLAKMIREPDDRLRESLDGLLAGFINLQPVQGWDMAGKILNDARQPFKTRYAAVRTLRFYYGWKPAEVKPHVLRSYDKLIEDGELADMPVDDLRRWQLWDLTDKVLAQYGKPSHDAPILQRNIIRYALCCPLPQARTFVERINRQDPDLIRELRESIELETAPAKK